MARRSSTPQRSGSWPRSGPPAQNASRSWSDGSGPATPPPCRGRTVSTALARPVLSVSPQGEPLQTRERVHSGIAAAASVVGSPAAAAGCRRRPPPGMLRCQRNPPRPITEILGPLSRRVLEGPPRPARGRRPDRRGMVPVHLGAALHAQGIRADAVSVVRGHARVGGFRRRAVAGLSSIMCVPSKGWQGRQGPRERPRDQTINFDEC